MAMAGGRMVSYRGQERRTHSWADPSCDTGYPPMYQWNLVVGFALIVSGVMLASRWR